MEKIIPITELNYDQFLDVRKNVKSFVYPKREISKYIKFFSTGEKAAINFWGWISIILFFGGFVLSFYLFPNNLWYLFLSAIGIMIWKANRVSIGDMFCKKVSNDRNFYERIQVDMGDYVKVVLR